jgi:glycosyltransferase involved in cell wall biosynthesis
MISVVVTCYNKREIIADCIKSILNQSVQDYELIVVDDGSTDGSYLIINEFRSDSKVKIFKTNHAGISAARNLGVKNALGNILLFLDGDCTLDQNALSELLSSFIETGADCVGGELRASNDHNILAKAVELMQNEIERKWPFGANVAYKKEVMEKVGGFDEKMEKGEDVELFLRVKKSGFNCVINTKVSARTLNPSSFSEFFKQRFRWGTGFAQLTERHRETFTTRIKLCFISTSLVLLSPLFALIDGKLILIFLTLLVLNILRSVPLDVKIARKSKDTFHSLIIPFLRFINRVAYFLGWTYWKTLELTGRRSKLEAFIQ